MDLNIMLYNKHIGKRIAQCRTLRFPYMTKSNFCDYLCFYGLPREKSFMTRLESGVRSLHDYELVILTEALCVTPSDLMGSHSLDHLKPIKKKYPDAVRTPPHSKNISGIDIFYCRSEILQQSQEEFAKMLTSHGLPVSRSKISRMECDKICIYAHELIIIANALGISYDMLLL